MILIRKILLGLISLTCAGVASAAEPTVMVLPDKPWCISKGYVVESERNGKTIQREDYDKALVDTEFDNVRKAIQQIMEDRGFPVTNPNASQEADDEDEMLDEAFEGAESGSGVQTNAYDEILKRAKPDITFKVGWNVNNAGSIYSADYSIEAIDSYSNKSVATIAGQTGEVRRTVPLTVALKQTAKNNMDEFCTKLQNYFNDVQTNGREIRLDVRIIDNGAGLTMNSEFGGKELRQLIYDWVSDNTVNHQFNERAAGRNMSRFNQVRIPLRDATGKYTNARTWSDGLINLMKSHGIVAENASTGLGAGRIYIGEK